MDTQKEQSPQNVVLFQWIKWLVEKRIIFLFVFLFWLVLALIAYKATSHFKKKENQNYLHTQNLFSKWKQTSNDEKALEKVIKAMNQTSALKPIYEAKITQALIEEGKYDLAKNFGQNVAKRTYNSSKLYGKFANTSLKIVEGQYQEALEEAKQLKEELAQNELFASHLFSYNLYRISYLEKKLNHREAECAALDELSKHIKQLPDHSWPSYLQEEKKFDHYLQERKKQFIATSEKK